MQNDTRSNFHRHGRSSRSVRRVISGDSGSVVVVDDVERLGGHGATGWSSVG